MAGINEVKVVWSNFTGAPGYSSFYFDSLAGFDITFVRAFFDAVKGLMPSGLTLTVPSTGDTIDDATGALAGTWSQAPVATVVGVAGGVNTGASGAVVHWLSDGIVAGRRVRGRTFLCPLSSTAFEGNGTLTAAAISTIGLAAGGLITSAGGSLKVWSRPTDFRSGSSHEVVAQRVPDLAAVMRSRR